MEESIQGTTNQEATVGNIQNGLLISVADLIELSSINFT